MKVLALALLALVTLPVLAQAATHEVDMTYAVSPDSANGTTGSVAIFRASGACPTGGAAPTGAITLTSAAPQSATTAAPYKDLTVTAGTWCYFSKFTVGGATSGPSTTGGASILPFPPTNFITVVVQ